LSSLDEGYFGKGIYCMFDSLDFVISNNCLHPSHFVCAVCYSLLLQGDLSSADRFVDFPWQCLSCGGISEFVQSEVVSWEDSQNWIPLSLCRDKQ
jgi:hypothetical protein